MWKHCLAIILLSLVIVLTMPYCQTALQALLNAHDWIANALTNVFSGGPAGNIIRQIIALLSIPILVGLIPAAIYWLARRHWFGYFMEVVWVVWLMQASALVIQYAGTA